MNKDVNPDLAVDLSELKQEKKDRPKRKKAQAPLPPLSERWPLNIRHGAVKIKTTSRTLDSGIIVTGPRTKEEREAQKERRAARIKRGVRHGMNHKARVLKATKKRRKAGSRRRAANV